MTELVNRRGLLVSRAVGQEPVIGDVKPAVHLALAPDTHDSQYDDARSAVALADAIDGVCVGRVYEDAPGVVPGIVQASEGRWWVRRIFERRRVHITGAKHPHSNFGVPPFLRCAPWVPSLSKLQKNEAPHSWASLWKLAAVALVAAIEAAVQVKAGS